MFVIYLNISPCWGEEAGNYYTRHCNNLSRRTENHNSSKKRFLLPSFWKHIISPVLILLACIYINIISFLCIYYLFFNQYITWIEFLKNQILKGCKTQQTPTILSVSLPRATFSSSICCSWYLLPYFL